MITYFIKKEEEEEDGEEEEEEGEEEQRRSKSVCFHFPHKSEIPAGKSRSFVSGVWRAA